VAAAEAGSIVRLDAEYCRRLVPARDPDAYKNTFGRLVCVAGSLDYAGAALLTVTAAARAGAGLVVLAVPASIQPVFAGRVPEVMTLGLPERVGSDELDVAASWRLIEEREIAALVMGPGMRETDDNRRLVIEALSHEGAPALLDAGALNLLARTDRWWDDVARACVMTPHPGEYKRLMGEESAADDAGRQRSALAAASKFGQVVLLKGARTVVASPDGAVAVSPFANAILAAAGSGDVLSGVIGALLAQGVPPFDAACLGVFLHGNAGERISERLGDAGLLASDLTYEIAVARAELARRDD
jgi:ADP-dependent NAD(P)H-hydrate dehydratase / NAD(P)H-hydrate epimerase